MGRRDYLDENRVAQIEDQFYNPPTLSPREADRLADRTHADTLAQQEAAWGRFERAKARGAS